MVEWTDERLNDSFEALRSDIRELRQDMRELRSEMTTMRAELHAEIQRVWIVMVGGYATIVAAVIATQL